MYVPMQTQQSLLVCSLLDVGMDVSMSFSNLQISLRSSNWYKQKKNKHFILCIMLQPWWVLLVVEAVIQVLLNI